MDCLFCKIVEGKIPSYTIYENEYVKAFLDINPDSNGHTLIIPKKHFKDFNDIDDLYLNEIMKCAKFVKNRIETVLGPDGITFVQNNGEIQEVKHFHLHLKPYFRNNSIMSVEEVYNVLK